MSATLLAALALASVPSAGEPLAGRLVWGDVDCDGRADVVVVAPEGIRMLHNERSGALVDWTERAGLGGVLGARAALFEDVDGDGSLDLLVVVPGGDSRLFVQVEGSFRDAGAASGLDLGPGILRSEWIDWNGDGLPELSLGSLEAERFYENLGGGAFREVLTEVGGPLGLPVLATGRAPTATAPVPPSTQAASVPGALTSMAAAGGLVPYVQCAFNVEDQATGACVPASSVPTPGTLYPLGPEFMITTGAGGVGVGIGTATPGAALDVVGGARAYSLELTATFGPPLVVSSSTRVNKLNADLLDGLEASAFSQFGASVSSSEVQDLTLMDADVSAAAAIAGTKIAPDFGNQDVKTSGSIVVNNPTYPIGDLRVRGTGTEAIYAEHTDPNSRAIFAWAQSPTGTAFGVHAISESSSGTAVAATAAAAAGATIGVDGYAASGNGTGVRGRGGLFGVRGEVTTGTGVWGEATGTTGLNSGVAGRSSSDLGTGVFGASLYNGLEGQASGDAGIGALAIATSKTGTTYGVFGQSDSTSGTGVYGSGAYGVFGESPGSSGTGVYGKGDFGVVGEAIPGGFAGVTAFGGLLVTGSKNFVQPHPTDPAKEIRFACLEGNESGTYFRGTGFLANGVAVIEVPEAFRLVTEGEGLTVQLTAVGAPTRLWVESRDLGQVIVRGDRDSEFDYQVNGVRRGFAEDAVIAPNETFRPRVAGEPYGAFLPDLLRQDLVRSGVLNPDFTPNPATVESLGWELREPRSAARLDPVEPQEK